jgi:hypothetical protein
MDGISGVQGSGSFFTRQQTDQTKNIRFENALAAARTADGQGEAASATSHPIDQVDFKSALPATKHQHNVAGAKMIQSLNNLVQNRPTENYGGLDIRQ